MNHSETYLMETSRIACAVEAGALERLVHELYLLRDRGGRLFLVGLGGGAANCAHAANDFRKLCGIEAFALTDSVAELTARINDEGQGEAFAGMMKFARSKDALFVFSVGGGADGVSLPIIGALGTAKAKGMKILGVVGRDGGATKARGDCVVVVPTETADPARVTPHTEAFQMVVLHCLVSHPTLQRRPTKW